MVTLNKSRDKGKIYTKVINLKGLETWRGTTIADDLSPDQLKDKRDLQAILVLAKFQNVEAKLSGLAIVIVKSHTSALGTRCLQRLDKQHEIDMPNMTQHKSCPPAHVGARLGHNTDKM